MNSRAALRSLRARRNIVPALPTGWFGFVSFAGFLAFARWGNVELSQLQLVLFGAASMALPMIVFELLRTRSYRRESAGLDAPVEQRRIDIARVATKLIGIAACYAAIGFGYWLLPEYHGQFYEPFYRLVRVVAPWLAVVTLPYVVWTDRRMKEPHDGYWMVGRALLGKTADLDRKVVAKLGLTWLVKGFFLPLMVVYFARDIRWAVQGPLETRSFFAVYTWLWHTIFTIDVAFAAIGYVMTLRIFDAHTRSVEPSMVGWSVALVCYQPFWGLFYGQYLTYGDGHFWSQAFAHNPVVQTVCGVLILASCAIYLWATVAFGLRFSNLTHRGILTHGPYRWVKHPAYVAKNIAWWLINVPFLASGNWPMAVRNCLLLLAVNGVYAMRAWTEQRHLRLDPDYVAYEAFIAEWGLFERCVRRPIRRARQWIERAPSTTTPTVDLVARPPG